MVVLDKITPYEDEKGNRIESLTDFSKIKIVFKGKNNFLKIGEDVEFVGGISFNSDNGYCEIGSNSRIDGLIKVGMDCRVEIGSRFTVTRNCLISTAEQTSVIIGDDCMFAVDNEIWSDDAHAIYCVKSGERQNFSQSVYIGNHVWLGMSAIVLGGTKIGHGSVIGHSSLVTKEVPNNVVAVGNPARIIKRDTVWERQHLTLTKPHYFPNDDIVKEKLYRDLTNDYFFSDTNLELKHIFISMYALYNKVQVQKKSDEIIFSLVSKILRYADQMALKYFMHPEFANFKKWLTKVYILSKKEEINKNELEQLLTESLNDFILVFQILCKDLNFLIYSYADIKLYKRNFYINSHIVHSFSNIGVSNSLKTLKLPAVQDTIGIVVGDENMACDSLGSDNIYIHIDELELFAGRIRGMIKKELNNLYYYHRVYIQSKLNKIKRNKNTEILVCGSSYSMLGVFEDQLPLVGVNIGGVSQDIYYSTAFAQNALKDDPGIRYVVLSFAYYFLGVNLTASNNVENNSYFKKVYFPLTGKKHNYDVELADQDYSIPKIHPLQHIFNCELIASKVESNYMKNLENLPYSNEFRKHPDFGTLKFDMQTAEIDINQNFGAERARGHSKFNKYTKSIEENKMLMHSFLKEMNEKNVKVILFSPPVTEYYATAFSEETTNMTLEFIEELKAKHEFTYLNLFNSELFEETDFRDYDHLNEKGAEKFTRILSEEILKLEDEKRICN